jgi:two-component system sensor kinase FixL
VGEPKGDAMPDHAPSAALLAAIAASSNDAIVGKTLGGIVTSWNAAAERLFGYTADEMIGRSINTIIPSDRIAEETAIIARIGRGERLSHFETERSTRDGRIIAVSLTVSPILDDSGQVIGISKIARDLTELHRLNAELRHREALLTSVLDTVPDGVIVIDEHGLIRSFSPAAERIFGYQAAEMLGRNVRMLIPTAEAAGHDGHISRYLCTRERHIIGIGRVVAGRRKDGSDFPLELQIGEVDMTGIEPPGGHLFTGFVRDLTVRQERERRVVELQAQLIHISRLSELGQLVSALAHEVNQPLTAIGNYVSGLRRMAGPDTPSAMREAIDKIAEQERRARDIMQSLRRMVRKETRPPRREALDSTINETAAIALVGTDGAINFSLRMGARARYAGIDRVQIQQVLLNLMRNAIEAMQGAAFRRLVVSTARNGDRIEVRVADTGPGISEAVRAGLFQPFVTSKAEGIGIGLSICRNIIEAHGGELLVESNSSAGAVFCFSLPAAAPPLIAPP